MSDLDLTIDIDTTPVVLAFDRSARIIDADGHMHVDTANISKANVCPYYGREIPNASELRLDQGKIYNLYRDAAELEAAAKTYENKPLMMQHVAVSAESPQKWAIVGAVSNVRFSYPYLKASLAVWDAEAIKAIENESQRELSCGYRYTADMTPGEIDGVKYDGVMRGLQCNHVALVSAGRAGPDVLVSDELSEEFAHMKKSALIAKLAPFLAAGHDAVALDAAIVALATDKKAKDEAEKEEADKKAAADKAAADKAAKDAETDPENTNDADLDDMEGEDEVPEAPEGGAPKPPAKDKKARDAAKAMDAKVSTAVTAALAQRDALHAARKEVEPVLGVVAFDSAAEVYGAALKKLGTDVAGVPADAYGAVYRATVKAAPAVAPVIATDSTAPVPMEAAFKNFSRLSR